ncbi:hypothetical protein [Nocardioides bruguierae]|uniref:Uncharacterized protein n=1 Tax=Nocardioides bruguierae TaxID=2945102 RepID=A0A9X2DAS9_9ACTN|nr:hypothetical protein [Nocardioides bruguierae]MCL8027662.1 hypothetical protein [Nocardioides bruguierae]MCM0621977.1 hypothetical protein [Nocardioides bruguierae]
MELIAVTMPVDLLGEHSDPAHPLDPATGADFVLRHSETALGRGLEPGEVVMLVDPEGEYHTATVLDLRFELEDTVYVLRRDARVPPEQVRDRMLHVAPRAPEEGSPPGPDDERSVVDLLGELRRRWAERDDD